MAHGEYVAIENLECIYGTCPFISPNGILVFGDSFQNSIVAVVLLKESYVKNWATENKITTEFKDLVNDNKLKQEILSSLKKIGEKEKKKNI